MALCTKKHSLLRGLLEGFGRGEASLRQAVQKQAKDLALTVGGAAPSFLAVVVDPPENSELLVLKMLHVLTEERPPPLQLVDAVMQYYHVKRDVRFLPPALGGLRREQAIAFLPQLCTLESRAFLAALSRLAERRAGREPLFSPAELLVAIHSIEIGAGPPPAPTLEQVKATIQTCLGSKRFFPKEALALTLQNMKQMTPLPKLFMWTVIYMSRTSSDLAPFILGLLREIVPKAWGAREQWQGYVMCCKLMAPGSFPLLAELSPEMLAAAAKRLPKAMLANLKAFTLSERCALPEVQRRRVVEVVDEAAAEAAAKLPGKPKPAGAKEGAESGGAGDGEGGAGVKRPREEGGEGQPAVGAGEGADGEEGGGKRQAVAAPEEGGAQ